MPVLSGQDIGQAHFATRALLERQLDGLPFPAWTALNLAGRSGSTRLTPDTWVAALMTGIKLDEAGARAVVDDLAGRGLVSGADLTPAGRAVFERITAATAGIVAAVYGGIPEEDQVVARRVLATVRERAEAELARAVG